MRGRHAWFCLVSERHKHAIECPKGMTCLVTSDADRSFGIPPDNVCEIGLLYEV